MASDMSEKNGQQATQQAPHDEAVKVEHLLRKAETILRQRTDRAVLVLERVLDNTNYLGALRTAEILGIQNIWVVQLPRGHAKAARQQQKQQGKQGQQVQLNKKRRKNGKGGDKQEHDEDEQIEDECHEEEVDDADQQDHEEATEQTENTPAELVGLPSTAQAGAQQGHGVDGNQGVSEEKLRSEIKKRLRFSRASSQWLDVQFFWSIQSCIGALKQQGYSIWATDLSKASVSLVTDPVLDPLPDKLAIIMGREADGVSKEMLAAADRRVYLPMFGFTGSLNVMVATGMVLQALLSRWPQIRGDMSQERRQALREDWYVKLARNDAQKEQLLLRAKTSHAEPYTDEDMKNLLAAHDQ